MMTIHNYNNNDKSSFVCLKYVLLSINLNYTKMMAMYLIFQYPSNNTFNVFNLKVQV